MLLRAPASSRLCNQTNSIFLFFPNFLVYHHTHLSHPLFFFLPFDCCHNITNTTKILYGQLMSSWLAKSVLPLWKRNKSSIHEPKPEQLKEEEEVGVSEELRDFVKSFTVDTFKNFSLPLQDEQVDDDDPATTSGRVRKDLSEWQERHASLVLLKVKEMSHLRYVLCPRHLKERQFWRIYFNLVKSYVTPYEIRAIQKAKLRRMGEEDEKLDGAFEVEMAEAKGATSVSVPTSLKHDLELSPSNGGITFGKAGTD